MNIWNKKLCIACDCMHTDHPDAYTENFEDEDVVGAFAYLFYKLRILFDEVNFTQLKNASIQRGTLLPNDFKQKVKAAV